MEQYEADINEIAHNYGPMFYIYHKSFSAKAANAIVEHNVVINWAKVDDRMLNLIMHGTPSRHCELQLSPIFSYFFFVYRIHLIEDILVFY